mgnify:CR=1 FL=1|jgi:hypothetical protein
MEQYTDLDGNLITVPELTWLEDGRDNDGNHCARYAIGNEESVWLDWDGQEVERE